MEPSVKNSKSLKAVNIITKVFYIISIVCFVIAIVSATAFIASAIVFLVLKNRTIEGTTLDLYIYRKTNISIYTIATALLNGAIYCCGLIATFYLAKNYFARNYEDKTPFSKRSANECLRLGIVQGGVAVGGTLLNIIVYLIFFAIFRNEPGGVHYVSYSWTSIITGVILVLGSFLLRYGSELENTVSTIEILDNVDLELSKNEKDKKEENTTSNKVENKSNDEVKLQKISDEIKRPKNTKTTTNKNSNKSNNTTNKKTTSKVTNKTTKKK